MQFKYCSVYWFGEGGCGGFPRTSLYIHPVNEKIKVMKTIAQQLNIKGKNFPFVIEDKNGNEIYIECHNGRWVKKEYDCNGNQIYWENSDGRWFKREYDSNGNEIYCDSSYGLLFDRRKLSSN